MELKIKRLHPDAIMPTYGSDGAACFDLYAVHCSPNTEVYAPRNFQTGLAVEVPKGYALMIYSRSGHGFNSDTRLANCVGVVDSDYRGEVMVKLTRDGSWSAYLRVSPGDRIAQAMLIPVPRLKLVEVDELSETVRGAGGFGSTGA